MKLTPSQLTTIETYLLSWELQFRDFYDEMFDHFCTEIEQRMSNGTSFDDALAETSYSFDEHEFKTAPASLKYRGVKAYEMEWVSKVRKKSNSRIINALKGQFLSLSVIVWALFCFGIYKISVIFEMPDLWIMLLYLPLAGLVVSYSVIFHREGFKMNQLFSMKDTNRGVHESKQTLYPMRFVSVQQLSAFLGVCSLFLIGVPKLFVVNSNLLILLGSALTTILSMLVYAFYLTSKRSIG
jgi:hypothetical protein